MIVLLAVEAVQAEVDLVVVVAMATGAPAVTVGRVAVAENRAIKTFDKNKKGSLGAALLVLVNKVVAVTPKIFDQLPVFISQDTFNRPVEEIAIVGNYQHSTHKILKSLLQHFC